MRTTIACRRKKGIRLFGHSKDHRDDLPQVVIAMAVTRDGILVHCCGSAPSTTYGEDRIRAHVQLCWLALLLMRFIENATGGTCATSATSSTGCTWSPWPPPTASPPSARSPPGQQAILSALKLPEPPRFCGFATQAGITS